MKQVKKRWFTADTHLNHRNIIKYCNRPFDTVEEMNNTIINNWNSVVGKHDTVYHLGDFCFGNPEKFIDILNGHIILIRGNHDGNIKGRMKKLFLRVENMMNININKTSVVLCHYAMRVWYKSHHNSWQLFGHSHGMLEPIGKQWDVGVDNNNFKPLSEEEIIKIMNERPDNESYKKIKRM